MNVCRHGLVVCLLLSLFASGCDDGSVSLQAREHLDSGLQAYQAGNNRRTVTQADAVLSYCSPRSSIALQAFYLRGMAWYRLKDFDKAKSDLECAAQKSDNTQLRIRAMDSLGEIAYQRGDMSRGKDCFRQVVELADRGQRPVDHAHYRLGCILQRLGRWQQADVHFQRVIYLFGRSKLATLARRRVNGRKWTIQVGSYEKRYNADLAAGRFRQADMKTFIEPVLRDGRMTFLLQAGRWEKYGQAAGQLPAARRIKADAFLQVTR